MRDSGLDIVKGLAIVLMVFGHVVVPGPLREFIYLFHMPVFFIAAGWVFRRADDGRTLLEGVSRRMVRIWWPYVFWATVLIACHDVLLAVGVYSAEAQGGAAYVRQGMTVQWGLSGVLRRCFWVPFLMGGATGLGAPYWFLAVLFAAAVAYLLADFCCRRLKGARFVVLTALAIAMVVIGRYGQFKLLRVLEDRFLVRQTFTAFALLHLGVLLRMADLRLARLNWWMALALGAASLAALLVLKRFGCVELVDNAFPGVTFLLLSATCGWYFLFAVVRFFRRFLAPFAYVGCHTLPILLVHLLAFKCVDAVAIALRGDDIGLLGIPVRSYAGLSWSLIYTAVGVLLPLALNAAWWRMWKSFVGVTVLKRLGRCGS